MNPTLIDTDILSYFLRGNTIVAENVAKYLTDHDHLLISEISYFEILSGLHYKQASMQITQFEQFIALNELIKLNVSSIRKSAGLYGELRRKGIKIGTPDLLIAGIALDRGYDLITNNEKHFSVIPGLIIKNWMKVEIE